MSAHCSNKWKHNTAEFVEKGFTSNNTPGLLIIPQSIKAYMNVFGVMWGKAGYMSSFSRVYIALLGATTHILFLRVLKKLNKQSYTCIVKENNLMLV